MLNRHYPMPADRLAIVLPEPFHFAPAEWPTEPPKRKRFGRKGKR